VFGSLRSPVWVFLVGSFNDPIVRLHGCIPLHHPALATLTIDATAISNGQFGITHDIPRIAMRAAKVKVLIAHHSTIGVSKPDR
jgi:hypothetical protein